MALVAGQASPLSIGGATLLDEEHPAELDFGLDQQVAVHVLVGGSRTVQSLGPNPKDVTWRGQIFADRIAPLKKLLRLYCATGQQVDLAWRDEKYAVVVRSFTPRAKNAVYYEYEIVLTIVADKSGQFSSSAPASVDAQINALLSQLQGQYLTAVALDSAAATALQTPVTAMRQSIKSAGPIAQTTGASTQSVLRDVQVALSAATDYLATISPGISSQLVAANQIVSTLTLIARNVQQGQSPRTIVVVGGTLYDVAAQYYGDASLGSALAAANGLATAVLSSQVPTTINLPPFGQAA